MAAEDRECDNRTMEPVTSQQEIGRRVSTARDDASLTQAELAASIGIDRTSVAKIESGARKVSATELVAIAQTLDRPIDWFVVESPPAIVSRRRSSAGGRTATSLDRRVEQLARDVSYLVGEHILLRVDRPSFTVPESHEAAEELARQARAALGIDTGALPDLQRACERVGLLAFSLDLGDGGGDAAYVEADGLGVALVNGAVEPGRRRFNLAHELAHHLVGDEFSAEVSIGSVNGTEQLLNAVAIHLLMPRAAVAEVWQQRSDLDDRLRAVAVAARFRVSWTATCNHLRTVGLLNGARRDELVESPPVKGDFFEVGERWEPELVPPSVPPHYASRVIHAYRCGKLTTARTGELLWGTVTPAELPDVEDVPLPALRRELEPL